MDSPLEIVYHHVLPSPRLEAQIRERFVKLKRLYPRIVRARVAVEMRHRQHRTGNFPEVHIEIQIPGHDVVVSNQPHHTPDRRSPDSLMMALRHAFQAAEERLKKFKQHQFGEVRLPPDIQVGRISGLEAEKKRGFIRTRDGHELYFHRNAMADGDFNDLHDGERVQYEVGMSDKGPAATRVWRSPRAAR
ncbi:MAG: HPF/RaiA family ribosome-associated protein [Alphaproteobacteria bacterium]|nr:HPF/RaiA family ribosome-associated protein [Alphaproteobacteria bacterium]